MAEWQTDLAEFYQSLADKTTQRAQQLDQEKLAVQNFYANVVTPAFAELKTGFEQQGRRVEIKQGSESASIALYRGDTLEYDMDIRTKDNHVYPVVPLNISKGHSIGESISFKKDFKLMSKDDLIQGFLTVYKNFLSHHAG